MKIKHLNAALAYIDRAVQELEKVENMSDLVEDLNNKYDQINSVLCEAVEMAEDVKKEMKGE